MSPGSTGTQVQQAQGWLTLEDQLTGLDVSKKNTLKFCGGDKVTVPHTGKQMGKLMWISPDMEKGKPICGTVFAQAKGVTWWVIWRAGKTQCVPQGGLTMGEI